MPNREDDTSKLGRLRAIGGLIAVAIGVLAVTSLAVFTLTRLDTENQESMVAITSSAFGIISALVGAYLGIKITADTNSRANEQARQAAVAEHEAGVLSETLSAVSNKVEEVAPEQATEIKAAAEEAAEAARAPRSKHHSI
jgi:hypothetical protein